MNIIEVLTLIKDEEVYEAIYVNQKVQRIEREQNKIIFYDIEKYKLDHIELEGEFKKYEKIYFEFPLMEALPHKKIRIVSNRVNKDIANIPDSSRLTTEDNRIRYAFDKIKKEKFTSMSNWMLFLSYFYGTDQFPEIMAKATWNIEDRYERC